MFLFLPWHHINIICSYFWCKQKGRKIVFSMSPPDSWYRSEAISPAVNILVPTCGQHLYRVFVLVLGMTTEVALAVP